MDTSTGRERIMAALHGSAAESLPWVPFVGPYFLRSLGAEEMGVFGFDAPYDGSVEQLRKLKTAIPRWLRADVWAKENAHRRSVDVRKSVKKGDGRTVTTYHTPFGDLEDVRVETAITSYRAEMPVKEKADLKALRYILESSYCEPNYAGFQGLVEETGDDGVIYEPLDPPPPAVLFRWAAPELVIYGLYDGDSEMVSMMEEYHRHNLEFHRTAAQGPAEVFVPGCSYLTTQLISPDLFERYVVPYARDYASVMHDAGKLFLLHMCGETRDLLSLVADAGVDGVDSITPAPVGNVDFQAARGALRDDFTMIGGLDAETLHHGTREEIAAQVKRSIGRDDEGTPSGIPRGTVLQTADVISYGTPLANLQTVTETLESLGLR